ncbi:hypothetical protein PYCCODRAFT_1447210 [Trametes coccinea BRFM310]|uniref:BZIP domain-containing protein n=1 Tax=Trametes coccinea (strain BRFM310) TaxID=1353009 RepID=A0A1Y2ICG1_TRAC3|nr:hypothetical protein PYCCODRAFT_1447210 [Trametes coccinea BRFM310]
MSSMHLPALHMSHIIAPDAPLTSPISDSVPVPWDRDPALTALYDPFSLPLSASPPGSAGIMPGALPMSVPDTRKVLRSRMSPDESAEQQCLPTHQVFDFAPGANPGTPQHDMPASSSAASTPESSPQTQAQPLPQRAHHTSSFSASSSSSSTAGTPSAGSVVVPAKRGSVGPSSAATKKARGERITVKDFVPPDVTGLSKREARLVKNRAAAFLSRQRKREEFENMEIRVAELEQENARLLALAQQSQQQSQPQAASQPDPNLLSEVEQLRRQLAETQKRERELAAKLQAEAEEAAATAIVAEQGRKADGVKVEAVEPQLQASLRAHKGERSGASFGLMVLLCALPTLLSMPAHHAMSNSSVSFSAPSHSHSHSHSTSLDMATFPTSDYDWNLGGLGSGAMDLDLAPSSYEHERTAATTEPEFKKLEFVDADAEKLGLSGLDISFDASAARDGRIRVRIHPPSASGSSSSAASENGSDNGNGSAQVKEQQPEEDQTMWHDAEDDLGPFLGVGANDFSFDSAGSLHPPPSALDLAYPSTSLSSYSSLSSFSGSSSSPSLVSSPTSAFFPSAPSPSALGGEYEFDLGSEYGSSNGMSRAGSPGALGSGRRRVRIALRGMPGKGKEGGEWEVEVC